MSNRQTTILFTKGHWKALTSKDINKAQSNSLFYTLPKETLRNKLQRHWAFSKQMYVP